MNMSSVARLQLQNREKMMLAHYDDMGPGRGNCTVGYGSLVHRNPCTAAELARPVTQAQAASLFAVNIDDVERAVQRNLKVTLTQAQFDALVSYTFNRGARGARPVFDLINKGDLRGVANEISRSTSVTVKNKAGKRVLVKAGGLVKRRAEESAPFRGLALASAKGAAK